MQCIQTYKHFIQNQINLGTKISCKTFFQWKVFKLWKCYFKVQQSIIIPETAPLKMVRGESRLGKGQTRPQLSSASACASCPALPQSFPSRHCEHAGRFPQDSIMSPASLHTACTLTNYSLHRKLPLYAKYPWTPSFWKVNHLLKTYRIYVTIMRI